VEKRKDRLIFIKDAAAAGRAPKMAALVAKAEKQIVRRTFTGVPDLTSQLYASLVHILERDGLISSRPFDARIASVKASRVDKALVEEFVGRAGDAGKLRLKRGTKSAEVLRHLNMLDKGGPSNAAVLLFFEAPATVIPGARVTCMHFPGTEPVRPALSQNVMEGPLFAQIDDSVEYVMSRLARPIGSRDDGARLQSDFEIPKGAVAEAIVNAVAYRDYSSNALTQVFLFADRLEVRNPGELPRSLTPEELKRVHPSIPHNPLLVDVLYRAGYVDRAGTGTLDMLAKCREANLAEPEFLQDGDQWVVRLWRDWPNENALLRLGLNHRQVRAMLSAKPERRLTTQAYMEYAEAKRPTAKRDLEKLVALGLLEPVGSGRGAAYVFARKWLKNGSTEH
jgi:predicted HTH transcriptional regulator